MTKIENVINSSLASLRADSSLREHHNQRLHLLLLFEGINNIGMLNHIRHAKELLCPITEYIKEIAGGNLSVPYLSQHRDAVQDIYHFDGYRWYLVDKNIFVYMLKEACKKMGVPKEHYMNPQFIKQLREYIESSLHKPWDLQSPDDKIYLNMNNGTLEIDNDGYCTLREHRKEDYFTHVLPYNYNPSATCELWEKFINEMIEDKETQRVLATYIIYCLTKNKKLEMILFMLGTGANGKSVILEIIKALLGAENVSEVSISEATLNENARCMLEGKLANISRESIGRLNEAEFKKLVSGEPVLGRLLYNDTKLIEDLPKFICSFNTMPTIDKIYAVIRRIILIRMDVTVDPAKKDPELADKLKNELSGILNWVLANTKEFMQNGLYISPKCDADFQEYLQSTDSVLFFFKEECEISSASTDLKILFNAYRSFCYDEQVKPVGRNEFTKRLVSAGAKCVNTDKHRKRFNITLKD